jgi:hypothetical protein
LEVITSRAAYAPLCAPAQPVLSTGGSECHTTPAERAESCGIVIDIKAASIHKTIDQASGATGFKNLKLIYSFTMVEVETVQLTSKT